MKSRLFAVCALIALLFAFAQTNNTTAAQSEPAYPVTVVDGLGRTAPLSDAQVHQSLAQGGTATPVATAPATPAAATGTTTTYPLTIKDGTGRELTLAQPPARVVCMLNRCAEELAFIGIEPVAVGAPYTYNVALNPVNFGDAAKKFGQVDQTDGVNWEKLASYKPDLIIGEAEWEPQAKGIAPLYALSWAKEDRNTVDGFLSDVRKYARIFNIEEAVEAKIQNVLARVKAYSNLSPKNRSVLVIFFDDQGKVVYVPPDCGLFLSEMTACGNPGSPDWIKGSVETLLKFDPDVIIVEKYSVEDEAGILANLEKNDPLWGELKAVKNKRVHLVPVSQARLNTIQSVRGAVDAIMPLAYPEVFPAPLTDEQVQKALAESK